jgi:hypothetical protein
MSQVVEIHGLASQAEAQQRAQDFEIDGVPVDVVPEADGTFTVRATYPDDAIIPGAPQTSGSTTAGTGAGAAGQPSQSSTSGSTTPGVLNPSFNAFFTALVPGGFFSSDPNASGVPRSIRTNNPGALNISTWQKSRPGFVSVTADDGKGNVTSIYCAPEYGVASWYHLLAQVYGFAAAGSFTIEQLAGKYAGGGAAQSTVDNYVNVWCSVADPKLTASSVIQFSDDNAMLNLARAMYRNEAGRPTPLSESQILFGIQNERNNSLPPPPSKPAGG